MKKITVRFDDELHKRLRFLSVELEESLQQMIVRLLRAELERHEVKKARRERAR